MKHLNYDQTIPATVWTIQHNFGSKVVADAFIFVDGVKSKILPYKMSLPDDNTLRIEFTTARSGAVSVVGTSHTHVTFPGSGDPGAV